MLQLEGECIKFAISKHAGSYVLYHEREDRVLKVLKFYKKKSLSLFANLAHS